MRGLLNERDVIPRDFSDLPVIAHVALGITTVIRSCPYFFIISVIGISNARRVMIYGLMTLHRESGIFCDCDRKHKIPYFDCAKVA